ncbi:bifunctional DNA primase/polymerase [Streptomyces sp. NPDC056149]|uniref:bifunctional DNA primase/polymerase n=1 Tax=unclassified Streptomyces TaxID=2593676 RepID=UPI00238177B1|nr:bifunctional DNA primase/polymerase [Streptomyces sp. WZ-12]
MSDWLPETPRNLAFPTTAYVTLAGADWLASASPHPEGMHMLWAERPTAPSVLPCGVAFDVIDAPALFGRRMVDRLWSAGPGSGPVAAHRGRILLFAAPGTAHRLPALLAWEEWGSAVPPLLCHGGGDAVTVPPLHPRPRKAARGDGGDSGEPAASGSRWLVAPDVREPWLPGPDVLLWACVRAARSALGADRETARPHREPAAQGADAALAGG